jgi:hypothetical protein
MKLLLNSVRPKLLFIAISLCLYLDRPQLLKAGSRDPLFPGPVRPTLEYPTELLNGYLTVYTATDRFEDGGVAYYPHSSYLIYTTDGKLFKKVDNHVAPSDDNPELVTLPPGRYTIEARSENEGYVRVAVSIDRGRRTLVDLDNDTTAPKRRLSATKRSQIVSR